MRAHRTRRIRPIVLAVAGGSALAAGVVTWLALRAPDRGGPASCRLAGELALSGAPRSAHPIEVSVCEGRVLATTNTGATPLSAWGALDGPLELRRIHELSHPAHFAVPLCIETGVAAIAAWGPGSIPRFQTLITIFPVESTSGGFAISSSELPTVAPCAYAVHPGGAPVFAACEHADPEDPRLVLRFEFRGRFERDTRDDQLERAKPHAIVAAYPFDDRPFVGYRAGDRLIGFFPSPFAVPNEGRFEIARGRLGDAAAAHADDRAVVVWPEAAGEREGFVLRAASFRHGHPAQTLDTGDPPATAVAPAIVRFGNGFVVAWIADATGSLEVGSGPDIATAVAHAQPIAVLAANVRVAARGDKAVVSWRDIAGGGHVARVACDLP